MADINDIMLLIDVTCADCGYLISLSNAYIQEYKYICSRCARKTIKEIDEQYGLEFDN